MARIVIIDDDPAMGRTSSRILTRAGHSVRIFQDGRKAIENLQLETADLLITDIFMPEMEGLETVQRAHQLNPGMPIIAMSGGGALNNMDYLRFAPRFGARATLNKPFRPSELRDLVANLLASATR